MANVIELGQVNPRQVEVKKRQTVYCNHSCTLWLNMDEFTVQCSRCKKLMTPFDALLVIAHQEDWEQHASDRQTELETKRVQKVMGAAVASLLRMNITVERYAELLEKERRRQADWTRKPGALDQECIGFCKEHRFRCIRVLGHIDHGVKCACNKCDSAQ